MLTLKPMTDTPRRKTAGKKKGTPWSGMDTRHYVRRIAGLHQARRPGADRGGELDKIELAYRAIIEETGAGVAAVDARGAFIFVNRGLCRMIGYSREELLGRPFAGFLHQEDREKILRLLLDARKSPERKLRLEFRAVHKDGRTVYCDARPTVLPARDGAEAFYAIINDMTAYREAEEKRRTAHERLQTLLSSTSAVFFACEPSGDFRTTYISDNVVHMTGHEPASFLRSPRFWENRLHPRDKDRVLADWPQVLSKKSLALEYRFRRRDGSYLWVREDMRLIEDEASRPREIIGFWVDITSRRKAEDLLRVQRDLSLKVDETTGLGETLRVCLQAAVDISEMDSGAIYLVEGRTGDLVMGCSLGLSAEFAEAFRRLQRDSPQARLVMGGRPVYREESRPDMPPPPAVRREKLRSMAAIPVRSEGRIIGSLNVSSRSSPSFPLSARLAVESIAGQIGGAIARAKLEEALRTGEETYRTLTENVNLGVYRSAPGAGGRFLEANPAMVQMFGFPGKEALLAVPVSELFETPAEREAFDRKLAREGFVRNALLRLKRRDGAPFIASTSAVAVRDDSGAVKYFDGIIEDITERQAAEDSLRKSEMMHRHLFEQSNDPIVLLDFQGRFIGGNQKAADMLGYRKDELIGAHFSESIAPSELPDAEEKFRSLLAGKALPNYERRSRRRDGTEFPVEINVSLVRDLEGGPLFIQSIVRDITERKKAEAAARASLREKDILLREVHHRVKNNMQVIVSLLRLQSRNIKDEAMRDMFRASQSRIQSMALIHEKLYQSRDLAGVDFGAYVEVLASYLRASSGMESSRVEVEVQAGDVSLDINRAIPCGLIINELVTNALKYAFPRGGEGRVRIVMSRGERGRFILTVSDNGVGLPEGIDLDKPETLGLQIVGDLVRQLDGRLAVDRAGGTTFRIDF